MSKKFCEDVASSEKRYTLSNPKLFFLLLKKKKIQKLNKKKKRERTFVCIRTRERSRERE